MSARIRGEHATGRGRWRPPAARDPVAPARARPYTHRPAKALSWRHAVALLVAAAAIAVGGVAAARGPRAWAGAAAVAGVAAGVADAYEAAAIDNPSRVCSELFAPALAETYATAMHGSCTRYFEQITSFSVVVRQVLEDRGTAVLELRQSVRPRDWAVVLSRGPLVGRRWICCRAT